MAYDVSTQEIGSIVEKSNLVNGTQLRLKLEKFSKNTPAPAYVGKGVMHIVTDWQQQQQQGGPFIEEKVNRDQLIFRINHEIGHIVWAPKNSEGMLQEMQVIVEWMQYDARYAIASGLSNILEDTILNQSQAFRSGMRQQFGNAFATGMADFYSKDAEKNPIVGGPVKSFWDMHYRLNTAYAKEALGVKTDVLEGTDRSASWLRDLHKAFLALRGEITRINYFENYLKMVRVLDIGLNGQYFTDKTIPPIWRSPGLWTDIRRQPSDEPLLDRDWVYGR